MDGFQNAVPLTKTVKWLIVANVALWFLSMPWLQGLVFHQEIFKTFFALHPDNVLYQFWFWQPFTYMFLHAGNPLHVLLNMIVLWWFGSELELKWGRNFFLTFYFVCGVGAAVIYVTGVSIYALISRDSQPLLEPVVGASGAVYGLLVAYGMIFGERMVYFMMMFPMKAKYFVWIMGLIELSTLMGDGFNGGVANLAHLGGIVAGYLFLQFWTNWRMRLQKASGAARRAGKLKLVVNNEKNSGTGPRYWN